MKQILILTLVLLLGVGAFLFGRVLPDGPLLLGLVAFTVFILVGVLALFVFDLLTRRVSIEPHERETFYLIGKGGEDES